jgi:hypothetical protein
MAVFHGGRGEKERVGWERRGEGFGT